MRKFLKFLWWLFIIILISGVVLAATYLLGRELIEGVYALGVIFGVWILVLVIRKLIIRYRAKAQVESVLRQEKPDEMVDDLGMTPRELTRSLKTRWNRTIKALKGSQLQHQGDALYVLPWYMIFGKPRSGKSTSLRSSSLLLPSIDLSEHEEGSTLNLEWWLYEEAIVIDTAGRYAVPDNLERDRKEWDVLLDMLARHKQKEPLNGLVLVVAADRLLNCSDEELLEEGRQVRSSINNLMDKLKIKVPVYLMVTKCDLIPGFPEWSQYLPEDSRMQAMGVLNDSNSADFHSILDKSLDDVLDRIKELRLLMMEATDNPDDSLLTLPRNMEKLRHGLHVFIKTALKGNIYQEAPRFRGLYFSSSQQQQTGGGEKKRGLFLHDFFTKVLPADRALYSSLPSAERLRREFRERFLGIGGALTFITVVGLTALYQNDISTLNEIQDNFSGIDISYDQPYNDRLYTAAHLKELIEALEVYDQEEFIPWSFIFGGGSHVEDLKDQYVTFFKKAILEPVDSELTQTVEKIDTEQTSALAGGLVRRINILQHKLKPEQEIATLPIGPDYLQVQQASMSSEASSYFSDLYKTYIAWNLSTVDLGDEKQSLQTALLKLVKRNHGDYTWIINWANSQGFSSVKLSDFWGGSKKLADAPEIEPAFTLEGNEFIKSFLEEFSIANGDDDQLSEIQADFQKYYQRNYIAAWEGFAARFSEGSQQFRDPKEWRIALERMSTQDNPFFSLLDRMYRELGPFADADYASRSQIEFFYEVQGYSAPSGKKGANKGAQKVLKKALGKLGKVGKLAKKGLKVHKKATKGQKGGEDLDNVLDEAVAAVDKYKQALAEVAFKSDSRSQSLSTITTLFTTPDTPQNGDGPLATAWTAATELQELMGKPLPSSRLFWDLYLGPIEVAYDYMEKESSCEIQQRWEDGVLSAIEGVEANKLGNLIVGEGGLLWNFLDNEVKPFVAKQFRKGYVRELQRGRSIAMSEDFFEILNKAAEGRFIVGNEFNVTMRTLPSGSNPNAAISPYATFLELHCADGVQTLANYNYPTQHEFKWSLETCGDTSLLIEIGQLRLTKEYRGVKGFSKFLKEFHDGHRIFHVSEFPNQQALLENDSVEYIDVNYEIVGQKPVIQLLDTVPLELPRTVSYCW